jgi:mono/diheme cytochrome c family protein
MRWSAAIVAALVLAGCAARAQDGGQGEAPTGSGPHANPAAPPAAGGPPPAPKPVTLVSRPGATGGEALYIEHCMHCHGPNGMGTGLLERRVDEGLLEARGSLPAQYVVVAVRQGIGNMPPIPRGEVTDDELRLIAEYIAAGPHPAAGAGQ